MDEKALSTLTPEQTSVIPAIVQQMMGPLVEAMAKLLKKKLRRLLWRMLNRLRVEMAYKRIPARFINPISKLCVALWEDIP